MRQGCGWKKRIVTLLLTAAMMMALIPASVVMSAEPDYELPWLWPVPGSYKINSLDYYYNGGLHNAGQCIDIGSNGYNGENRLDIVSATDGTVLYIQNKYDEGTNRGSGWGNYVVVRSGNINIVYGHLQTVTCTYGAVKAGDVIGKMGNTGNSTGVHLHLQAYPSNENSSSAAIRVFEQYRTNPLYAEKFQFMKGLKTASVAYGDWISSYYTNSSGSYYAYSGGLFFDFDVTPVSASVTVINTSGADVRSQPVKENAYNVDTLKHGTIVRIGGYHRDAYGTTWLLVMDENNHKRWILADDVGFREYHFQADLQDVTLPEDTFGAFWDLSFSGKVLSENIIDSLTIAIRRGGETVATCTQSVGSSEVTISDSVKNGFDIDDLADGRYTCQLSVVERATYPGVDPMTKEQILSTTEFTIESSLSDRVPPLIEAIHVTSLTPYEMALRCMATDNKHLERVEIKITSESGLFSKTLPTLADGDAYFANISCSELNGAGKYILQATAYDSYGNTDVKTRTVVLGESSFSETWTVLDTLRVRSGPSTSYDRVYTLKAGAVVTITAVESCGTYQWGKLADGWCAIDFCRYESGHLYQIQFDLNGADGEVPAPLDKRYGVSVNLPVTTFDREGYAFLGWAYSSDATTPDFVPGATFSDNTSATLFAVWSDTTYPSLVSVTRDSTKWTNSHVTLTIHGTDNTGSVYYSFDGGNSWGTSGTFTVRENTVFPARTFAIKDSSNNITYYQSAITVDNIDQTAPDMTNATALVSDLGGATIFTVTGIVDEQSGLSQYEVVLSQYRDFHDAVTRTMTPGSPLVLAEGVYYWRLQVTDGAGNTSQKTFERFRVGPSEPLPAPTGLAVTRTTSETVVLGWNPVENADYYVLSFSRNHDFSDPVMEHTAMSTSAVVSGLEPGVSYYARIVAKTSDDIFLPSEPSDSVPFLTMNDDCTIRGFVSMADAMMDHDQATVAWVAPYATNTIDLSVLVDEKATVSYWYDESMTGEMTGLSVRAFPFTGSQATAYIYVAAENGEAKLYTVTVTRAAKEAASPNVMFSTENETIYVGEAPTPLSLTASSADGGTVTVEWFLSYNGGTPSVIGNGSSVLPLCEKAGTYVVYAVATNENSKCQVTTATVTTASVTITVQKIETSITVLISDYEYHGNVPSLAYSGYIGDGAVTYRFFSDAACEQEIAPPVDAGVYYVIAYGSETDRYLAASSQPVSFEIQKKRNDTEPILTVVQPSLRDRNGYVTVGCDGVEYRVVGTEAWMAVEQGTLTFDEKTKIEFRLQETANATAGPIVLVTMEGYEGADDIRPNDGAGFTIENGYLLVNDSHLTTALLLTGLENSKGVLLYTSEGERLNGTDKLVGTGCRIVIEDELGNIFKSLDVIILGDLNGDGIVLREDADRILELSNGMTVSDSPFDLPAGDMNHDGILTSADAYLALLRS